MVANTGLLIEMRVKNIGVLLKQGMRPEEMIVQYPSLNLAQVHAALAYYYDHKAEMDADIQRTLEEVDQIKAEIDRLQGEPPLIKKLRAMGQLP